MKFFAFTVLVLCGTVFTALPARAQYCDTLREVIVTLRPPEFGFPSVWDAAYGKLDQMVQFTAGIPTDKGTVMTIGRKLERKTYKPLEIVFAEINRRARVLLEKSYPVRDAEYQIDAIRTKTGFLVLSNFNAGKNLGRHHVRLAWYDAEAGYKRDKIIEDPSYDFHALRLAPSVEGQGFVVVLHAINRADEKDEHGVLMHFSSDGNLLWRRAYRPGIPNQVTDLVQTDDNAYIATGRIRVEDGRMAGWAMKLAPDGTILWQRMYPRGNGAVLTRAAISGNGSPEGKFYIVTGTSVPTDGGPTSAWLMEVDRQGDPKWQRYYRRPDFALEPIGVRTYPDARMVLAMNAIKKGEGDGRGYIRMLTLSPRAVILEDESYINGLEVKAVDMSVGINQEEIITTTILSDATAGDEEMKHSDVFGPPPPLTPQQQAEAAKKKEPVQEGWVFLAPALDPYDDPCKPKQGQ